MRWQEHSRGGHGGYTINTPIEEGGEDYLGDEVENCKVQSENDDIQSMDQNVIRKEDIRHQNTTDVLLGKYIAYDDQSLGSDSVHSDGFVDTNLRD
ncbi:hypothetical protein OROGR_003203 [Orobanche gracilis]